MTHTERDLHDAHGMIVLHEHPTGNGVYVFVTSTKVCSPPDVHARRQIKSHRPSFSKSIYSPDGGFIL